MHDTPHHSIPGLVCRSLRMQELAMHIERAAAIHGGVVVSGEPGSGRGIVARTIHSTAQSGGAPFVAVYCHKADPSRIEMELFGSTGNPLRAGIASTVGGEYQNAHERIAPGSLLHRARNGTIYFVHLARLSDRVQARLAHLLRDREALISTSREPEPFAVRPMMAVDAKFSLEFEEGRIRPDLYKRLAAVTINVPPLRERREDIPELARFFLDRTCRQRNLPSKSLAPEVLAVLAALPWKGNAREMNGLLESLVLKSEGPEIGLSALLAYVRLDDPGTEPLRLKAAGVTLRQARIQFEREYISAVLAQHRGRIPEAARALGIQRTNLYRKLRSLQLMHGRHAPTTTSN